VRLPARADELADYYVLDIRAAADYAAGHIAGAVNVPFADVAKPAALATLPADRPILVVCYSGHTASTATAILDLLGYDAWTLRFGMLSWKPASPTAIWSPTVKQGIVGAGYPLTNGVQP
jgi:rhodanese-related sulfurtransferase